MSGTLPLAAVLLAQAPHEAAALRSMIANAREVGAAPIVVVLAHGAEAPGDVRIARVSAAGPRISAIRAGLTLLANSTARLALVWPLPSGEVSASSLDALADAARREGAAVTAFEGVPLDDAPLIVARDAWLELLTLGERGMQAVVAKRGASYVTSGS